MFRCALPQETIRTYGQPAVQSLVQALPGDSIPLVLVVVPLVLVLLQVKVVAVRTSGLGVVRGPGVSPDGFSTLHMRSSNKS